MNLSVTSKITLGLAILALAACGPSEPESAVSTTAAPSNETQAVVGTALAVATEHAATQEAVTATPSVSATPEPSATPAPTSTPVPVRIGVSEPTNCRRGPAINFALEGVLEVGEQAEVVAKSADENYWYIVNPDDPATRCWLLGAYATIDGQAADVPVLTPEPTPTPQVGFDVWFHGFASCGGNQLAIFAIHNGGAVRLWSGWIGAYTVGDNQKLYGPVLDRHPFSETATETCPPGHGNELYPGEVNYVLVPLKSTPSETDAYVEFELCSADHGGGDCVTKIGYFYIP